MLHVCGVHAEPVREHRGVVFADAARSPVVLARRFAEADGQAIGVGGAEHRMRFLERRQESRVAQLRVAFAEVRAGLHDAGRHASILATIHHVRSVQTARPGGDVVVERSRRGAALRRVERVVLGPGGLAQHALERLPVRIRHAGDGHPALVRHVLGNRAGAGVAAVRRGAIIGQGVAARFGGASVGEVVEQGRPGQIHAHLELGKVDALAMAAPPPRFQRGQNGHGAVQPGAMVVVGKADADVLASRHAGEVGEAGQRMDGGRIGHELRPRPAVAHAGHLHVDGLGIGRAHVGVAHAPALQHADGKVVDDHVGAPAQAPADVAAFLPRHVQSERALVAVPHRVVDAVRRVRPGAGGRVHLDDVRAEVGKDARGERPGQHMGEVEDAHAGQRRRVRVDVRRGACFFRRGALRLGWARREPRPWLDRGHAPGRVAETVWRARAAHSGVAEPVGLPPVARFKLRILRHLVERQHPAVGRMAFLRLEEQLLHVPRRDPLAQHIHHAADVEAAIGGLLVLRVEQILLRLLLDQPDQLIVEVRRGRHHDAAASRRHHDVGVRPVQTAATLQHRPGGVRQVALVPHPHQDVLQTRRDAFMHRNRAVIAKPRASPPVEGREHRDGRVGAGEHEVQLAERFEGRRVCVARRRGRAAEGASDQIRRQMVPPRAVGAERRHVDHHQIGPLAPRVRQLRGVRRESASADHHDVRFGEQRRQLRLAGGRFQRQFDAAPTRREERMPQRLGAAVEKRAAPAQRVAAGRLGAHHVGAEIGQQLGAVDGAFVGEIKHADSAQRTQLGHPISLVETLARRIGQLRPIVGSQSQRWQV